MAEPTFIYRVTLAMPEVAVVPEGSAVEMASWLNAQLGKDTVEPDLGPPLSATGEEPITHRWCSAGWEEADARSMLGHLADLGGIERPSAPQWNGWTMEQKCAWVNETLHPAMLANASGGVLMVDARGVVRVNDLLATMGLQRVVLPFPPKPEPEVVLAEPKKRRGLFGRKGKGE